MARDARGRIAGDPRSASDPALVAFDVGRRRGRHTVLDGVSFVASKGVLALVGSNGAGKSTLLSICAGHTRPSSGYVQRTEPKRPVGYLPQVFPFPRTVTIREFVRFAAWIRGSGRLSESRADDALDACGLTPVADLPLGSASGGMVRRAGFAASIVDDPGVLILDEPTTGVDPEQRAIMRSLIAQAGAARVVIMSSHVIEDVTAVADSMIVLERGRIAFEGTPGEAVERTDSPTLERAVVALSSRTSMGLP